jgi:hypothetical protein
MAKQSPKDPRFRCNICKEYFYAPDNLIHYQCPIHGYLCEKHVFTKDSFLESRIYIDTEKIKENYIRYKEKNIKYINEQKLSIFLFENKHKLFNQNNVNYFDFNDDDWPNAYIIFHLKAIADNLQCCNFPLNSKFIKIPYDIYDEEFKAIDISYNIKLEKSGDFNKFLKTSQVDYCNKKTAKFEWDINKNKWVEVYFSMKNITNELEENNLFIDNCNYNLQIPEYPEYNHERDRYFEEAAKLIVSTQIGSTSLIQRRLKLGYNRAGSIMDDLETLGIVGPIQGSGPRLVLYKNLEELDLYLESLRNI